MLAGLLLETGEARDVHHMCTLLGYGADAICPYLAMEAIVALQEDGKLDGRASRLDLINNYIKVSNLSTLFLTTRSTTFTLTMSSVKRSHSFMTVASDLALCIVRLP